VGSATSCPSKAMRLSTAVQVYNLKTCCSTSTLEQQQLVADTV
jgi:hypothetical protein